MRETIQKRMNQSKTTQFAISAYLILKIIISLVAVAAILILILRVLPARKSAVKSSLTGVKTETTTIQDKISEIKDRVEITAPSDDIKSTARQRLTSSSQSLPVESSEAFKSSYDAAAQRIAESQMDPDWFEQASAEMTDRFEHNRSVLGFNPGQE